MFFRKTLCTTSLVLSFLSPASVAGQAPVVLPDSSSAGVGDTLAPANDDGAGSATSVSSAVSRNVMGNLRSILLQRSVPTVAGNSIAVPEQTVSLISEALSATGGAVEPAIQALANQLGQELGDVGLQVTMLGTSPADFGAAVASMNDLIMGLNSQQLAQALESPTLMALHRMLSGTASSAVPVSGESNPQGIIQISAR